MSETIQVTGKDHKDPRGNLIPGQWLRDIEDCIIDIDGQNKINGQDTPDGNTDRLRILAPGGSRLVVGEWVTVRGEGYKVLYSSFDYSHGRRRPAVARHRPRTLVIVERREA